jgi:hypothetical protein
MRYSTRLAARRFQWVDTGWVTDEDAAGIAAILRAVAGGHSSTKIAACLGVHLCTIRRVTMAEGAAECQGSKMQSF